MLLSDIKSYLQQVGRDSLENLSKRFLVKPDLLRDMLSVLVRKGMVRTCLKTPRCQIRCLQCRLTEIEIYEWVGRRTDVIPQ